MRGRAKGSGRSLAGRGREGSRARMRYERPWGGGTGICSRMQERCKKKKKKKKKKWEEGYCNTVKRTVFSGEAQRT
jgi:hypothetical protein